MPGWSGRRQCTRYPIVLPVLYGLQGPDSVMSGAGWTRDLSEGGACLELAESLDVTLIRVFLRTDQGGIGTEARVVWARVSRPGGTFLQGVALTDLDPNHRQALRELILRKGMVWQAVVRIPLELSMTYQLKGQPGLLHHGQTENVSGRGLSLRLPLLHPVGTFLEVTLHTPHGPLKAEGTIVRVDPYEAQILGEPIRHGYQFTDISQANWMTLSRVLAEAR